MMTGLICILSAIVGFISGIVYLMKSENPSFAFIKNVFIGCITVYVCTLLFSVLIL